ncbi:MAG: type VI secretion system baseplate subunit TssE [Myxococcaceae bacterium]
MHEAPRGLLARIGWGADSAAPSRDVGESVAAHLRVLLNARQGDALTAPDLGLIDFTELVHGFPFSIGRLQQSIRETLLRYEPRLKQVTVRHVSSDDPLLLRFEIVAQLAVAGSQGPLRFHTEVKPGGKIEIR